VVGIVKIWKSEIIREESAEAFRYEPGGQIANRPDRYFGNASPIYILPVKRDLHTLPQAERNDRIPGKDGPIILGPAQLGTIDTAQPDNGNIPG
jgi:hypothetical protein